MQWNDSGLGRRYTRRAGIWDLLSDGGAPSLRHDGVSSGLGARAVARGANSIRTGKVARARQGNEVGAGGPAPGSRNRGGLRSLCPPRAEGQVSE